MNTYRFEFAWTGDHWLENAVITVDDSGRIERIESNEDAVAEQIDGIAIPGMTNVHSHAFQWTFAGKSELRTAHQDSFWTWREQMYASLAGLNVESYYASAKRLFAIMAARGYTSVGEFHYVHHAPDGRPHDPLSAMANAMVRAATDVGLAICILPVMYQRGGFDERPLAGAQKRFELNDDQFIEVIRELHQSWSDHPNVNIGIAFHSLRAVDPAKIASMVERCDQIVAGPIHIHVAEQTAEVDDCLAAHNRRPVELLFDYAEVDDRWCLIHATHLSKSEIELIAASKSVVGLCPTTEANLGDGIFSAEPYLAAGGRIAIGSDSHVAIDPYDELRMIEYGQRLISRKRAILCDGQATCGTHLYGAASGGGAQALGFASGRLAVGNRADIIVLDRNHPMIQCSTTEHWIDRIVFGNYGSPVARTMINGKWVTQD